MKIFFSTLLWMAVFGFYTFVVSYDLLFKEGEGVKTQRDAIKFFDPLIRFIQFYLSMIIFFLWKFWLLAWGHYYLMVKRIKNIPAYYLTSMLYILTAGALWVMVISHVLNKNFRLEGLSPAFSNISSLWKKHLLLPYLLVYVLTAFLLAFFQRRQFKNS